MKRSPIINPDWPSALTMSDGIIPFYGSTPKTRRDGSKIRNGDLAVGMSSGEVLRHSYAPMGRDFWSRADDAVVEAIIVGLQSEMPKLAEKITAVMRNWS